MRKATPSEPTGRGTQGLPAVGDLVHVQNLLAREPGDLVSANCMHRRWPQREVQGRNPEMDGHEKSDGRVVPTKQPNKGGKPPGDPGYGNPYTGTKAETPDTAKGKPKAQFPGAVPTAEAAEGRRPAKENLLRQTTHRTQGRARVQHALERVRVAAKRDRKMQFTTLFHHVFTSVANGRGYETNAAVMVIVVVPADKTGCPTARRVERRKWVPGILRPILERPE